VLKEYRAAWYAICMVQSAETLKQQNTVEANAPNNKLEKGWTGKGENRKLTNDMQFELARRFYGLLKTAGHAELSDVVFRWVDEDEHVRSKNFRDFVEAHPEVVALYKTDPDAALKRIEENIYERQHS